MNTEKQLYRSRNALIGGVCAGVAEYFNIDPLVVRILTVAFSLASAGLFAVAYVALWVVLPQAPNVTGPFDVEPHSVRSDTYGSVDYEAARVRSEEAARAAASYVQTPYGGTGHVPPEPPVAAAAAWHAATQQQVSQDWQPPRWEKPVWQEEGSVGEAPEQGGSAVDGATIPLDGQPAASQTAQIPTAACAPPPAPPYQPQQAYRPQPPQAPGASYGSYPPSSPTPVPAAVGQVQQKKGHSGGVKAALWFGSTLLFFGVVALLDQYVEGVSWWQFWPLLLGIFGIVQMVVPGEPGQRVSQFVGGLMLFCMSGMLLLMSLGVLSWFTVEVMARSLWPLLIMMVGFFILGAATKSGWWTFAAGLCFVAFCAAGLIWFAIPGSTNVISLVLPFGKQYTFEPWNALYALL